MSSPNHVIVRRAAELVELDERGKIIAIRRLCIQLEHEFPAYSALTIYRCIQDGAKQKRKQLHIHAMHGR